MVTTIVCVESERAFDCKMIRDGKIAENWSVSKIDLISGREQKTGIITDLDRRTMIATTEDDFECKKEADKLICRTVSQKRSREGAGWIPGRR